jgi:outer membrane protein assembly factor BamB
VPLPKGELVKLYVDTSAKHVMVSKDPVEKNDQNGRQRTERNTGRPMWSTQVVVQDEDGAEVISITTAGERPNVKVGQTVSVSKLEALPWSTNGKSGVAFRSEEVKAAGSPQIKSA